MYEPRYDWIDYPDADPGDGLFTWEAEHVGVRVRVLCNPSMLQVRNETKYFMDSANADIEKQDAYWQYIAERIPEWNLSYQGKPIPPPAEGWEILLDLPFNLAMWLRISVHLAHIPKVLARLQNKPAITDSTPTTSPVLESSPA